MLRTPGAAALLIASVFVLGVSPGVTIAPSPVGDVLGEVSGPLADEGANEAGNGAGAGAGTGDVIAPSTTTVPWFDPTVFAFGQDEPANGVVRPPEQLRGYRWPLTQVRITQPFGPARSGSAIVNGKPFHDGIDLATFCSDHVLAAHDGVVLAAGRRYDEYLGWKGDLTAYFDRLEALGLWGTLPIVVVIDDGNGYRSIYAHMYKVTVKAGAMTIDLSECSGERRAAVNSRTYAAPRIAYKALTAPLADVNEGSFRALNCIIPEGNIMMARHPMPMAAWSQILPLVVDTILAALAKAIPDKVPAGHFGLMGGGGVFFGLDPKKKKRYVVMASGGGGWGGRPFGDGESAAVNVCQGDVRRASVEEMELKSPVLIQSYGLRVGTAGPGKFRGGMGGRMHIKNLIEGRWNLHRPKRDACPAWGLNGGVAGPNGILMMKLKGEEEFHEVNVTRHLVPADTEVIVNQGSGGGWGSPFDRDPELVRWDVVEELVTREAARDDYGVVLRDDLSIDATQTQSLRRQRALSHTTAT